MIIKCFVGLLVNCNNSPLIQTENSELLTKDTSFECYCTYPIEPFDMNVTLLSGGYHLKYHFEYSVKDSLCLQVVDLMKEDGKIEEINSFDYRIKKGSLGWLEFDYQEIFVFILGVSSSPSIFFNY